MVLTNPHMKPRIEFIIMKIFMKIVKICPKSPRFTGIYMYVQFVISKCECPQRFANLKLWKEKKKKKMKI